MLALCTEEARRARCEWLHVDFVDELRRLDQVADRRSERRLEEIRGINMGVVRRY
jgi:hypothetical protein